MMGAKVQVEADGFTSRTLIDEVKQFIENATDSLESGVPDPVMALLLITQLQDTSNRIHKMIDNLDDEVFEW